MSKISFGSPWMYAGTGLGLGILEGAELGERRQERLQQRKQQEMQQAMQLLGIAIKAEEVQPGMGAQVMQMLPGMGGGAQGVPQALWGGFDPAKGAERKASMLGAEQKALASQAEKLGYKPGTPEHDAMVFGKTLTRKDMVPWTFNDGSTHMISAENAARLERQEMLKAMVGVGKGGGGGGAGKPILHYNPQTKASGKFVPGAAPPGFIPATASNIFQDVVGKPPSDIPQATVTKLQAIAKNLREGGAVSEDELAMFKHHGGTANPYTQPSMLPAWLSSGTTKYGGVKVPLTKPKRGRATSLGTDDEPEE